MKRTKHINHASFRKHWRTMGSPLALTVSAVFILTGCEKSDGNISLYMNSDNCTHTNPSMRKQYTTTHNAQKEVVQTTPKYASHADCMAEFGENQCIQVPAQTGMAEESQHNGSIWIPLMTGYMMGYVMSKSGYTQQPQLNLGTPTSQERGQFIDVNGRNYGLTTRDYSTIVPKTALETQPTITQTITRGGFGKTVAKQNNLRSSRGIPYRTMGG